MPAPQPTLALADVGALLADLEAFTDGAVGDGTKRAHERHWKLWVQLCTDAGEDPARAPLAMWEKALEVRRKDGRYYSAQRPGALLSAVRYNTDGCAIPAPDRPEHRAEWKEMVVGYGRLATGQACTCETDGECTCRVTPATRAHVNAMLCLPYTSMRYRGADFVHRRRANSEAAVLVALDTGLGAPALSKVHPDSVELLPDGSLRIENKLVPCDHRPRERGVPWPCGACAVRSVLAERPAQERLFGSSDTLSTLFATRRREWHRTLHASPRSNGTVASELLVRDGLTPRQIAGVRLGLALSSWQNPEGAWLLGRAWFTIAFAAGYRMCGDLASLSRSAVTFAPDGSYVSLTLGATKSDQNASTTVVRPFYFGTGDDPVWAAECFATYLAVRDALVGEEPDQPLWMCAPPKGIRGLSISPMRDPGKVANGMLATLTQRLDLPHLTSYSARKGYAEEAFDAGWEPTRVQAGMRHVFIETTLRHYREKRPQVAASRLADKRAEELASRRAGQT